mmetsp:Transcript_59795/g.95098  ORF Transcript_59795/g.95098 Transcript_59795/m.95098 type:complete len:200 (+) Transcript_59795:189-788(+)
MCRVCMVTTDALDASLLDDKLWSDIVRDDVSSLETADRMDEVVSLLLNEESLSLLLVSSVDLMENISSAFLVPLLFLYRRCLLKILLGCWMLMKSERSSLMQQYLLWWRSVLSFLISMETLVCLDWNWFVLAVRKMVALCTITWLMSNSSMPSVQFVLYCSECFLRRVHKTRANSLLAEVGNIKRWIFISNLYRLRASP